MCGQYYYSHRGRIVLQNKSQVLKHSEPHSYRVEDYFRSRTSLLNHLSVCVKYILCTADQVQLSNSQPQVYWVCVRERERGEDQVWGVIWLSTGTL